MDLLDRMLGHDRWATTQLLELCDTLTDAQLDQEFDIGHHTLRETLDHMIYVIDFWTGWMSGRPVEHDRTTQQSDRSIAALSERHERYQATFAAFARQASDEQRLDDTFNDHYAVHQSIGATIVQVQHHNAQHRSEVRHMLERLGVAGLWDYDPQEWEHSTGRV
ncbi:MAG TPA: DinB family protein [Thermomicrobiales bacterium]|nr:DinB family protein [Thermomicrobiales bacterium]